MTMRSLQWARPPPAVAGHGAVGVVGAGELRRDIGVPAVRFHLHVRLVAGVGSGLHHHGGLDVARLVAEHLLALAGVGGVARDGDDAALARRGFVFVSIVASHVAEVRRRGAGGLAAAELHDRALIAHDVDHAFLVALHDGDRAAMASETHFGALARSLDVHRALGGVAHHGGAGLDLDVGRCGRQETSDEGGEQKRAAQKAGHERPPCKARPLLRTMK